MNITEKNNALWMAKYNLAKKYKEKYGDLRIPRAFRMDNVNIGLWIGTQRAKYAQSELSNEKIELLEEIGMLWRVIDESWNKYYAVAEAYYEEHGDLKVPIDYVVDGLNLGNWISIQRQFYVSKKMSAGKINKLEAIGMVWNLHTEAWDEKFNLLKAYYEKHGDINIPQDYNVNGYNLYRWLTGQKHKYKQKRLTYKQIDALESIGIVWDSREEQWYDRYQIAIKYYKENGHLKVPYDCIIDGVKLGIWISTQRVAMKNGTLSDIKIKHLNELEMVWDAQKSVELKCPVCGGEMQIYKQKNAFFDKPKEQHFYGLVCENLCTMTKAKAPSEEIMREAWLKKDHKDMFNKPRKIINRGNRI